MGSRVSRLKLDGFLNMAESRFSGRCHVSLELPNLFCHGHKVLYLPMLDWEDFGIPVGPLVDDPVVSGQVGGNDGSAFLKGKFFGIKLILGW